MSIECGRRGFPLVLGRGISSKYEHVAAVVHSSIVQYSISLSMDMEACILSQCVFFLCFFFVLVQYYWCFPFVLCLYLTKVHTANTVGVV